MINAPNVKPGMRLGRYLITQELGAGGMGRVWKALDEQLQRAVALKVLHSRHAADPVMAVRFKREPLAMARMNHPGVAQVFALEEQPGLLWFAMEYVEGRRLSDLISDEYRLPVARAVEVFRQVAAALSACHAGGVIHRDLKPGNVIIEQGGRAVLADFGLAKTDTWSGLSAAPVDRAEALREFDSQETPHQGVVGTPAYLAPERWLQREYDARMDIYSFGCMMFHAVTGEPPFGVEPTHDMMTAHIKGRARALSQLAGPVPEMLERITARCMEKDPDRRFQSADELHRALCFFEKDIDIGRSRLQQKIDKLPLEAALPAPPPDIVMRAVRVAGVFLLAALLMFALFYFPLLIIRMKAEAAKKQQVKPKAQSMLRIEKYPLSGKSSSL